MMPSKPDPSVHPALTMSNEQFQKLLEQISVSSSERFATHHRSGNFAKCTSRFDGSSTSDVDAFLDSVLTYKDCANVSNDNAFLGIPMLLEGVAATWWKGIKNTLSDWDSAVVAFRDAYSRKLPPHLVYRELFSREQRDDETTEMFICHVRSLMSQLPYTLLEHVQLDMVYGLLKCNIRKRLLPNSFKSFKDLLRLTRDIEISERETSRSNKYNDFKTTSGETKIRPRCKFCSHFGHMESDCRKKIAAKSEGIAATGTEAPLRSTIVTCYGCGAPGYIRSNCPSCKKSAVASKAIEFCTVNEEQVCFTQPVILIEIHGANGVALIDTGAKQSIAGHSLYLLLLSKGCQFKGETKTVILADGIPKTEEVLITQVPVCLQGRVFDIVFFVLKKCKDNKTLLGIDFLKRANIVINIPHDEWHFIDDPSHSFPFYTEEFNNSATVMATVALRSEEGSLITSSERELLSRLLEENDSVFQPNKNPTPFAEHRILTGENAPISVPPYRMSPGKKDILSKELDYMLENDVIEECESPWAAPVVLVPKKDGSMRVCVDYRKLNSITVPDSYPLPRLDDLLHLAKQTPYMSTLDLRAGYWQVSVRECDRDKTAFVTPFGTYRFRRMPFGLRNSASTFQRLIDRFRSGLPEVSILTYIDDIIIMSETFEKHLHDLKAVFERLRLYGLCAKREKCTFVTATVKFLGHFITRDGIQTDPGKVSAILNLTPPSNLKHLLSFLQMCSWYRRFVPNFAEVARPLTELTKKNKQWTWAQSQQKAFELLKKLLTMAPILRQADQNLSYILKTDASSYALGACLLQGEAEDEHPVEYASRLLTTAEKNYSTTEREALAVVWAVEKFRGYIECSQVTVCTDHQALRWLMSLKSPTGRLARWALLLQSYNLEIKYTPGRSNVVADALSRPPVSNNEEIYHTEMISIDLPVQSSLETRKKQQSDPELRKIMDAFEKDADSVEYTRWTNRGYIMSNGILYRYNPDIDEEDAQLVVPEVDRKEILRKYHDEQTAGHYGVERTLEKISKRFYWPGMRRFVTEYVKRCPECQRYKANNLRPAGLLQTPVMSQRFETLSIDLFGPLPVTKTGNRWILIVEDVATKWVELFPLAEATAQVCAQTLVREVFFRFGTPRKVISDNGVQFTSTVMQQVLHCLGVKQSLVPLYHPSANPVERKNRDLKTQLSILVGNDHSSWSEHLAAVRFAMNTARCQSTNYSAAFLVYGTDLRTPDDVNQDLRAIVQNDNFIEQVTPYLLKTANVLRTVRDTYEREQDRRTAVSDTYKRHAPKYVKGDNVLVQTHAISSKQLGTTSKFAPRRDGPFVIISRCSPTSYSIGEVNAPDVVVGIHHVSQLTPYVETPGCKTQPVQTRRRRGRPRKPC